MNLRAYYLNVFINFNFDFGVLKFQFFFFNLSSKVLAGVRVRTSKYPYMDICEFLVVLIGTAFGSRPLDLVLSSKIIVVAFFSLDLFGRIGSSVFDENNTKKMKLFYRVNLNYDV